jgi:hypothetical protein
MRCFRMMAAAGCLLIPGSAQIEPQPFLAPSRACCQRLTMISADEAGPLIELHSGVIAVKDPKKGSPDSSAPQLAKDHGKHSGGDAGTPALG